MELRPSRTWSRGITTFTLLGLLTTLYVSLIERTLPGPWPAASIIVFLALALWALRFTF